MLNCSKQNSAFCVFNPQPKREVVMKTPIIVGLMLGALAVSLTWILKSETLPFNEMLYESSTLTAIFAILNLPVLIVLMLTRIDYPPFALFLIFVQWFLIGLFVVWLLMRIKRRPS